MSEWRRKRGGNSQGERNLKNTCIWWGNGTVPPEIPVQKKGGRRRGKTATGVQVEKRGKGGFPDQTAQGGDTRYGGERPGPNRPPSQEKEKNFLKKNESIWEMGGGVNS